MASLNSSVAKSSVTKRPNASPSSRSLDTTLHQPATPLTAPKDKGQKVNGAASTIGLPNGSSKNLKTTSSTTAGTKGSPEDLETKSLVVVLKIPKSVRKNWAGLIRFAPRPKKLNVERSAEKVREKPLVNGSEKPKENLPQPRANLQPNKQDTSRTGEKRRRPVFKEEPEPSNKRQKPYAGTGVAHKPHTPARPIKSPAVSQPGSAQRPQNSTPKRDLKSVAMRRITSQDVEVKTPSGGTRGGTPAASGSAERGNRDGRSISNPSAASLTNDKGEEVALWRAEQNRFLGLGKALKHEADSILKPKEDMAIDPIAKNQGTAIAIETILCYILGFTAGDEAARANRKAGDASGWRSLLAYIHFVKAIACATPHLSGLVLQLEAICRDIVHAYDLERLERDPLPYSSDEAQPPAAAGTESNPVAARDSTDKASSNRREYVDFKSKLIENARLAQQSWLAGTSRLSIDELSQSYPKTWAKRAKAPAAANGREKLVAKNYSSGGFYLPLSSTSSGIEAVRMGWSFLKEWTAKEGVKWEGKLGL